MAISQTHKETKMEDNKVKTEEDVRVENHGGIFMFTPMTGTARSWVDENVHIESWMWMGASFACDQRFAEDLAMGMQDAGLVVT